MRILLGVFPGWVEKFSQFVCAAFAVWLYRQIDAFVRLEDKTVFVEQGERDIEPLVIHWGVFNGGDGSNLLCQADQFMAFESSGPE